MAREDLSNPTPQTQDEQSISGSMPQPDAISDTETEADKVGLYQENDAENPAPLDIAEEVDEAEDQRRGPK